MDIGTERAQIFGHGIPVPRLSDIEAELRKVWRANALQDRQEAKGVRGQVRVTLSNVILLLSQVKKSDRELHELITEIGSRYPSRIFVVLFEGGAVSEIHATVSSRCVFSSAREHVCSEEIYLGVPESNTSVVRNLLLSLLVPDVSTILVTLADPHQSGAAFVELIASLNKITESSFYDSNIFRNYIEGVNSLQKTGQEGALLAPNVEESSYGYSVKTRAISSPVDISWLRTEALRFQITQELSATRFRGAFNTLEQIRFEGSCPASGEGCSGELLFLGWLTSRFSLHPVATSVLDKRCEISFQDESGKKVLLLWEESKQSKQEEKAQPGAGKWRLSLKFSGLGEVQFEEEWEKEPSRFLIPLLNETAAVSGFDQAVLASLLIAEGVYRGRATSV